MTRHFHNEIEKLKKKILSLTAMVEENLQLAVKSISTRDTALADKVVEKDYIIDSFEVEVEEECLKILALHQPVAADLRYVVAALKINNDLERIGDLAVNIAKRTKLFMLYSGIEVPFDLDKMLKLTMEMVQGSIDALIDTNDKLADEVCEADNEMDQYHKDTYTILKEKIAEHPELTEYYITLLNVSRNLERIADHATNIAEDVIYLAKGEIIRHQGGLE